MCHKLSLTWSSYYYWWRFLIAGHLDMTFSIFSRCPNVHGHPEFGCHPFVRVMHFRIGFMGSIHREGCVLKLEHRKNDRTMIPVNFQPWEHSGRRGCFLLTSSLCQVVLLDQPCLSALMPWSCTCGYPLFCISFHRFPSSLRRQEMEKNQAKLNFPLGGKKALCWYVASLCGIKMREKKKLH